jgi:hypothetical protein
MLLFSYSPIKLKLVALFFEYLYSTEGVGSKRKHITKNLLRDIGQSTERWLNSFKMQKIFLLFKKFYVIV